MAKVSLTKLGLKVNNSIQTIMWNDQEIEVKQYLPINDKLTLISNVLNHCSEDEKYYNMGKFEMYFTLEVIYNYTNINPTEKQKEDICKLYDAFVSSGLYDTILESIDKKDMQFLREVALDSIKSIYAYSNSVMGIIDAVTMDYKGLDLDANQVYSNLADPQNMELLKGIMTRLG